MQRGLVRATQRMPIQAKPRMFFFTGVPALALLKCLQWGEKMRTALT